MIILKKIFKRLNPDTDVNVIDWDAVVDGSLSFKENLGVLEQIYPMYRWQDNKKYNIEELIQSATQEYTEEAPLEYISRISDLESLYNIFRGYVYAKGGNPEKYEDEIKTFISKSLYEKPYNEVEKLVIEKAKEYTEEHKATEEGLTKYVAKPTYEVKADNRGELWSLFKDLLSVNDLDAYDYEDEFQSEYQASEGMSLENQRYVITQLAKDIVLRSKQYNKPLKVKRGSSVPTTLKYVYEDYVPDTKRDFFNRWMKRFEKEI